MSGLTPLAQTTAQIYRFTVDGTTGKSTGGSSQVITNLKVTQPVSIDYNTAQRVGTTHRPILQAPYKFKMLLYEGSQDVRQGDTIEISGNKFPIRHVEVWPFIRAGEVRNVIIIEDEVRD